MLDLNVHCGLSDTVVFVSFSTILYTQEVRDGNLLAVLLSVQKNVLLLAIVYSSFPLLSG